MGDGYGRRQRRQLTPPPPPRRPGLLNGTGDHPPPTGKHHEDRTSGIPRANGPAEATDAVIATGRGVNMALAAIAVSAVALILATWIIGALRTIYIVQRALARPVADWTPAERAAAQRLERNPARWPA